MDGASEDGELERFRTGLFGCARRWGDALFELTDAALCAPGALRSVPSLSLAPGRVKTFV